MSDDLLRTPLYVRSVDLEKYLEIKVIYHNARSSANIKSKDCLYSKNKLEIYIGNTRENSLL